MTELHRPRARDLGVDMGLLPPGPLNAKAIVNALIAAETMTGRDGITAHALPHATVRALARTA